MLATPSPGALLEAGGGSGGDESGGEDASGDDDLDDWAATLAASADALVRAAREPRPAPATAGEEGGAVAGAGADLTVRSDPATSSNAGAHACTPAAVAVALGGGPDGIDPRVAVSSLADKLAVLARAALLGGGGAPPPPASLSAAARLCTALAVLSTHDIGAAPGGVVAHGLFPWMLA